MQLATIVTATVIVVLALVGVAGYLMDRSAD
jgi:hypothetical protein